MKLCDCVKVVTKKQIADSVKNSLNRLFVTFKTNCPKCMGTGKGK